VMVSAVILNVCRYDMNILEKLSLR